MSCPQKSDSVLGASERSESGERSAREGAVVVEADRPGATDLANGTSDVHGPLNRGISRRLAIDVRGHFSAESLVRPNVAKLVPPAVALGLLRLPRLGRKCFELARDIAMHALMATVAEYFQHLAALIVVVAAVGPVIAVVPRTEGPRERRNYSVTLPMITALIR